MARSRVQSIRSNVAGARPASQEPGTIYTNFADLQIGVADTARQPKDLVAVRFFATTASYTPGQLVVQNGKVYRAVAVISPSAFDPTKWQEITVQSGSGIWVGDEPRAEAPVQGQLLWESDLGDLFVWYEDADGGQWVQINTVTPDVDPRIQVLIDDTNRVTYPEFSSLVTPDGDWAPAFNALMAARRYGEVPPGNYRIKSQISTQQEAFALQGLGVPRPNGTVEVSARLFADYPLPGQAPMFLLKHSGHLNRLAFRGLSKDANGGTGVFCQKVPAEHGAAYEDMDVDISECTFTVWHTGVRFWNRGLRLQDNLISGCIRGLTLMGFDDANFVDDPANPFDAVNEGFRAIVVRGNRLHALTTALDNTRLNNDKLRGLLVADNILDIGDSLWIGGLHSGVFANNIADQCGADVGFAEFTTAVDNVAIIGNLMQGDPADSPVDFVRFDSTVNMATITGNTLRQSTAYGINFLGAVSGGTITGNSFQTIGTDGSTRACIRNNAPLTNVAISGNYFDPAPAANCVRGSASQPWTGVTIQGNSWNRANTLVASFVDGGNNSIQTFTAPATQSAQPLSGSVAMSVLAWNNVNFSLQLTFTAAQIPVADAGVTGSSGSLELLTFNAGVVQMLGSRFNWTAYAEGAALTGGAGDASFSTGFGSVAAPAADGVLTGTSINFGGPRISTLVGGAGTGPTLATGVQTPLDGTSTAVKLFLNWSGTAATIDANSTFDVTGTLTLNGMFVGDD